MENILTEGLSELGLTYDIDTFKRFRAYFELLEERNKVMNLTAISGAEDVARLHFLDCAALLSASDFTDASVIDVGTGAGFPGLPLKIMRPGIRLTLLDSQKKRVDFLAEAAEKLAFSDICLLHARAEDAAAELRESFDIAVSRAVARLNILCELCLPFVRPGGCFLAMKGPDCRDELAEAERAITVLGGKFKNIFSYTIPGSEIIHSVVMIEKIKASPLIYPRRYAKIQKTPL